MFYLFRCTPIFLTLSFSITHALAEELPHDHQEQLAQAKSQPKLAFSTSSLYGANRDIDLSVFSISDYVAPGIYNVSLSVNNKELTDVTVKFEHLDASASAVLCVDRELLKQLDLKPEVLKKLAVQDCLKIKDINPDAYYDFNLQQLKLDVYIPLIAVEQRPNGYINPERFDYGVSSAFLSYNANIHKSDEKTQNYLNLNGGLNLGGWYFRHNGYFESAKDGGLGHYRSSQNTLYRDIDQFRSRLSVGEFYSRNIFGESLALVGGQLSSDDNMLPWSMRNYSPVIQGVANTNALVKVFQNGQKIYEKSVPAGVFELTDLSSSSNGELTVEIIENGGEKRVLRYPMQLNLNLLKKGLLQYNLAYGRYKIADEITNNNVLQGTINYGVNNNVTAGGAVTFSDIYKNYLASLSFNSYIGGINTSVDYSRTKLFNQEKTGLRYQVKYNYFWLENNINVNFNMSHQSRDYQTANSALSAANFDKLNSNEYYNFWSNNDLKNQYGLSVSKSFGNSGWGALQASIYRNEYWMDNHSYNQYTMNYSNRWGKVNYNLGISRSQDRLYDQKNNTYYASVSVPLDWRKRNIYINSGVQRSESDYSQNNNFNFSLSGTAGDDNNINYGVGINRNEYAGDSNTAYNGNINYLHPFVNLGAMIQHDNHNDQYSFSASGGLVGHRYGITATNNLSDTYTIVHVDQGHSAGVNNAWGVRIDRFGNAIYSNNSPYSQNVIQVDPDQMPANMTLQSNQATVIPRQYSSTLVRFAANESSMYVLRIHSDYGQLPMGAEVYNEKRQLIGRLAQSNQVLLDQFNPNKDKQLTVSWGKANQSNICQIQMPELKVNKGGSLQIIAVECK
ncbi:fimbria/pilus outer membrane usher protein [Acinetobacter rudis]|uniref:Fimbria/pilus outer membrane usher protein n=1 Tax=Acinetobacter rudis TaxID=632955 RepID=A0AAW8J6L2_9GAMM|nr:fimbria/pilus outer membrane usher protein [Acinetobacter rudis]MDQ8935077.1 fimbria/pilus outer membrane usher protein [Acinetobacter rudis]MDQ9017368.1 fimbria/pilus outer membrane usher protein [Acinetobacter rudis]